MNACTNQTLASRVGVWLFATWILAAPVARAQCAQTGELSLPAQVADEVTPPPQVLSNGTIQVFTNTQSMAQQIRSQGDFSMAPEAAARARREAERSRLEDEQHDRELAAMREHGLRERREMSPTAAGKAVAKMFRRSGRDDLSSERLAPSDPNCPPRDKQRSGFVQFFSDGYRIARNISKGRQPLGHLGGGSDNGGVDVTFGTRPAVDLPGSGRGRSGLVFGVGGSF